MIVRKNGIWTFELKLAKAKEKQPTIIFIDEIDAIGTKRFDSEKAGDREVQRTMLELLSQLDGFEESNIYSIYPDKFSIICNTYGPYYGIWSL